jgi:nucleotide-binding universal stress UspA family protein
VTAPNNSVTFRRIVVALDASEQSRDVLEAAAELAASLQAELEGVFVEDANLFNLVRLPFVRELRMSSAVDQAPDAQRLERELRALARQVEGSLAAVARQLNVSWRFKVLRGRVEQVLIEAAMEGDLLMLGRMSPALPRRRTLGSTARAVAAQAPGSVLLVERIRRQVQRLPSPVCVVYDGGTGADRALAAAASLARRGDRGLVVLVVSPSAAGSQQLQEKIQQWLDEHGVSGRLRTLPATEVDEMARAVREAGGSTLVVDGASPLLSGEALTQFLEQVSCPVLLVREHVESANG